MEGVEAITDYLFRAGLGPLANMLNYAAYLLRDPYLCICIGSASAAAALILWICVRALRRGDHRPH